MYAVDRSSRQQVMRIGAVCALRAGVHVACTCCVYAPHMWCACVSGGTACFIDIVCVRGCGPVRRNGFRSGSGYRVRLQRCRVCACAALVLCAVCMHWGRPPAELCASVRWAKLAWRFGCVGAVRCCRPGLARRRSKHTERWVWVPASKWAVVPATGPR
jgi:hypothetical protein